MNANRDVYAVTFPAVHPFIEQNSKMPYRHLITLYFLFGYGAYAQDVSDTGFIRHIRDSAILLYTKTLGENLLLYNGREYTGNYSRTIGHPFYASDRPQKGSIVYDGIFYPHSAISYDLTNEELFIKTARDVSVKLVKEKIDRFSIGDHMFVKIGESADNLANRGFYEVLYNDSVSVLVSRKKQLEPTFNLEDHYRYVQYDRYFIRINNIIREVQNEGSLFSLFPGYQKETRKYMRNTGIRFKKDRENFIIQAVRYYGQIKK